MKSSQVNLHIQALARRRGVNLASRHARLLKSNGRDETNVPNYNSSLISKPNHGKFHSKMRYFQGILIPQKPIPPSADECCMSNCRPCVHDMYLSSLARYKADKFKVQSILEQRNVPTHTWPSELRQNHQVHSLESQADIAETKAIYAAQEAKRIMTTTAIPTVNGSAVDHITSGRDMLLEAGKLVFWVLKGCPG